MAAKKPVMTMVMVVAEPIMAESKRELQNATASKVQQWWMQKLASNSSLRCRPVI